MGNQRQFELGVIDFFPPFPLPFQSLSSVMLKCEGARIEEEVYEECFVYKGKYLFRDFAEVKQERG